MVYSITLLTITRNVELTVNDIGFVEFRIGGIDFGGVFAILLNVFVDVPTSVFIKDGEYQAPLFIWAQLIQQ